MTKKIRLTPKDKEDEPLSSLNVAGHFKLNFLLNSHCTPNKLSN